MKINLLVIWLILLSNLAFGQFPNNPCYVEDQVCEANEDNLVDTISNVETIDSSVDREPGCVTVLLELLWCLYILLE